MDRKIFNKVYAKYFKKDYWLTKKIIQDKLLYAKENNIAVKLIEVKQYLRREKEKCFTMMVERIKVVNDGGIKQYPAYREKFTHAIIKELNRSIKTEVL